MKIDKKRLLTAAAVLILTGIVILGIGRAVTQNKGESTIMENQTYAMKDVGKMTIVTDSPSVVIKPGSSDTINLSWQEDEYVEFQAELENGELSIDYRTSIDWLTSLLTSVISQKDYVLEIELPDGYTGGLTVSTASGKISVNTAAEFNECNLTSVSGGVDAANIRSLAGVAIRSTSGRITADIINAADDIRIQTVSGGITANGLQTAKGVQVKTTSGRTNMSQVQCEGDITAESVSGSFGLSDIACEGLSVHTISGGVSFQDVTASPVDMKTTSGSIKGALNGTLGEYSVSVKTVSGKSNLQNTDAGKGKSLTLHTVSGGINVEFSGTSGE